MFEVHDGADEHARLLAVAYTEVGRRDIPRLNRIRIGLSWMIAASLAFIGCQSVEEPVGRNAPEIRKPVHQTIAPRRRKAPAPKPIELQAPHGDPVTVGCSDGQREGFIDGRAFPTIAGCSARWNDARSLRQGGTISPCGDDDQLCFAPQDACSKSWHVCGANGDPEDLRGRVSAAQCKTSGPFAFLAGFSHVNSASSRNQECGPSAGSGELTCQSSGWGSEPVCCGAGCAPGVCRDAIWKGQTQIFFGANDSCGRFAAELNTGILCCKD